MKPAQIIAIEKQLGIELSELKTGHIFHFRNTNTYQLSPEGEIIGLSLREHQITDVSFLQDLIQLTYLDLSYNKIADYSILKSLTNLTYLYLINNEITDISFLQDLDLLIVLNLSDNQIKDISFLKVLKQLKALSLWGNQITDISSLKNLTNLTSLDLVNNNITNFSVLQNLKQLTSLYLHDNKIKDITFLKDLKELTILNLSNNHLTDISSLRYLDKIESIDLEYNDINDITALLKIDSIKTVKLKGNKKVEIDYPVDVLEAGWEAVKQYSEKSKEKVPFKNVKVLLLGNPNIGKSNLLEFLETNAVPIKNESTHGVNYKKIVINEVNFHIWDFGGQEYFHTTHKLFFSPNAINIILWGKDVPRNNEIENVLFDLNYWLRTVEQLNNDYEREEVLIIENKIDLNSPVNQETNLNQKEYSGKYKKLNCTFTNFSLLNLKRTDVFKDIFIEKAESIFSKFNYPAFYEVFWKRIQEKNREYVTVDEINNRPHKENVIAALKVFHNMGMLLYFHDITPNKVFCKPQVLLDLLYEKILSKDKKDRLSKKEIEVSISNNSLDIHIEEVIKLLKHFDLVFEIEAENDMFFIPQYLKSINPFVSNLKNKIFKGCNIKIFGDNYLMSLAMLKIFSKYGNYVSKEENEYWFWRNGLIIEKNDSILMIEFNRNKQIIELYLDSGSKNLELQKEVVDFILYLPESIDSPKRNFDNHKKKRWLDVQDPDDEDHSPNFSERIQNYDGYLEHFEHRNWVNDYFWESNYFTVNVSIDCEYFIEWKILKLNENLSEINFKNEKEVLKKVSANEYCYLINKNPLVKEEIKKTIKVFVTYSWSDENGNFNKNHQNKVGKFTNQLIKDWGIDAHFDLYEEEQNFIKMMIKNLTFYDKIIIVLSEGYAKRADEFKGGVGTEYERIINDIQDNPKKYILVSFDDRKSEKYPFGFKGNDTIVIKEDLVKDNLPNEQNRLLSKLKDEPIYEKPELGKETPAVRKINFE